MFNIDDNDNDNNININIRIKDSRYATEWRREA